MAYMICTMSSLSEWLCWIEGCLTWFINKYMLFRLFVNMNVSMVRDMVFSIANSIANSSALRLVGYPSSLVAMLMFRCLLNTL